MRAVNSCYHQAIDIPSQSIKRAQQPRMGTKKRSDPMPLRYLYSPQNSNSNDVSLLIVLSFRN